MLLIGKTWPVVSSPATEAAYSLPRLCLLTETFYPVTGGGETQARALAQDLLDQGFKVFVIARRSSPSLQKVENVSGVTVYRIPPTGLGRWKRWGMTLWSLVILAKMQGRFDILYVSGFKALGVSAVLISKLFRKICILKADSNGEMSGAFFTAGLNSVGLTRFSPIFRVFLCVRNKILRRADAFVAITSGISEELKDHGVSSGLIYSMPNSVSTRQFQPVTKSRKYNLRHELHLPNKEILITYSGRLVAYKGLPLLIKVAHRIQKGYGNVGWAMVGTGGMDIHNCEAELRDYVTTHGLENSIYFAGEVNNVHEYLQASDIFVSPTEKDAFPLALVEAMACGLPVVTTPVGGIQEIITNRQNGLLVEPGHFQQLYEAISTLIEDQGLSALLGGAALQTVREKYSAEAVAAKYAELLKNLAA